MHSQLSHLGEEVAHVPLRLAHIRGDELRALRSNGQVLRRRLTDPLTSRNSQRAVLRRDKSGRDSDRAESAT
eukprot:4808970-Pleurochrysis_carterae.AAC.2